jgi:hypothetical protein
MRSDVLSKPQFVAGGRRWRKTLRHPGPGVDAAGRISVSAALRPRLTFESANQPLGIVQ